MLQLFLKLCFRMGFIPEEQRCAVAELAQRCAFLAVPGSSESGAGAAAASPLCCHISSAATALFLLGLSAHTAQLSCFCSSLPSGAECARGQEKLLCCPQGLALVDSVPLGFARLAKSRAVPEFPQCTLSGWSAQPWGGGQCCSSCTMKIPWFIPSSALDGRACFPKPQCRRDGGKCCGCPGLVLAVISS